MTGMGYTASIGHARDRRLTHWLVASALPWAGISGRWSYCRRPRDTVWDLSAEYLKPVVPRQKRPSHNRISNPCHLRPGSTLRIAHGDKAPFPPAQSVPVPWGACEALVGSSALLVPLLP